MTKSRFSVECSFSLMNVEKSLKEIGEHVSLLRILTSLRFSSVAPFSGMIDGVRKVVYFGRGGEAGGVSSADLVLEPEADIVCGVDYLVDVCCRSETCEGDGSDN
jgi:hypothetical protein